MRDKRYMYVIDNKQPTFYDLEGKDIFDMNETEELLNELFFSIKTRSQTMSLLVMKKFLEDINIQCHLSGDILHIFELPDRYVDEVIEKCEELELDLYQKATPVYLPYDPNDPETKDGNLKIKSFIFASWIEPRFPK